MTPQADERGFTLVEVLIALSIVSLVMVLLISTFSFAQRTFQFMYEEENQLDEITAARRLFADALDQITTDVSTGGAASFDGERNRLSIFAIAPRILGVTDPIVLNVDAPQQGGLIASWSGGRDSVRGSIKQFAHHEIASAYHVWFSYFSIGTGWVDLWSNPFALPSLLRVGFLKEQAGKAEFEITFPIRRVKPMLCSIRPAVKACEAGS
jgi:general secretion pathway protein J